MGNFPKGLRMICHKIADRAMKKYFGDNYAAQSSDRFFWVVDFGRFAKAGFGRILTACHRKQLADARRLEEN
jgi:hypothetical protein